MGRQFGVTTVWPPSRINRWTDTHRDRVAGRLADWLIAPLDRSTRAGGVRLCVWGCGGVCVSCGSCEL